MLRNTLRIGRFLLRSAPKPVSLNCQPVYYFQDNRNSTRAETIGATWKDNLPKESHYNTETIELQEVQSRVLKVLSNFESINLRTFQWEQDFKQLGLDSLNQTALLVSVEQEFTIIFPDGVFEGFQSLQEVVTYVQKSINAI